MTPAEIARLHRGRNPGKDEDEEEAVFDVIPADDVPDTGEKPGPSCTVRGGRKRTSVQREHDLRIEAELYLKGWYQYQIADYISERREYDISQGQISHDLRYLRERWLDSALVAIDRRQAEELARINQLERQYWEAWENSLQDHERDRVEEGAQGSRTLHETRTTDGNPRYLEGIQWCIERRIEMFGLNAPKKLDVRRANLNVDLNLETMSADELEELERILSKAVSGPGTGREGPPEPDRLHDVDV